MGSFARAGHAIARAASHQEGAEHSGAQIGLLSPRLGPPLTPASPPRPGCDLSWLYCARRPVVGGEGGVDHDDGIDTIVCEKQTVLRKRGRYLGGVPAVAWVQVQKDKNQLTFQGGWVVEVEGWGGGLLGVGCWERGWWSWRGCVSGASRLLRLLGQYQYLGQYPGGIGACQSFGALILWFVGICTPRHFDWPLEGDPRQPMSGGGTL